MPNYKDFDLDIKNSKIDDSSNSSVKPASQITAIMCSSLTCQCTSICTQATCGLTSITKQKLSIENCETSHCATDLCSSPVCNG